MITRTDEEKYFRTSSLPLAIFLYAKDQQITGISPTDSSKKEFVFVRSLLLDALVVTYKFGKPGDKHLLVQVHLYEHSRNELLDRLNER